MSKDQIIFSVRKGLIQNNAEKLIGRPLTEEEIKSVKKGIESGLSFDLDTVIKTAIEETLHN